MAIGPKQVLLLRFREGADPQSFPPVPGTEHSPFNGPYVAPQSLPEKLEKPGDLLTPEGQVIPPENETSLVPEKACGRVPQTFDRRHAKMVA